MKLYPVKNYTPEEWDNVTEEAYNNGESPNDDEITIVWHGTYASMDIQATGKRIVPILRKIEKSMCEAGLTSEESVFSGWFGAWADSLTDSSEKRYFIWQYDGKNDRDNGHWSYSWGIEQIDEDRWYIFLNIATASSGIMEYLEKKQAM